MSFGKTFTKCNIEKGFNVTGIHPLSESIFGEDEFMSYFTDRPYSQVTESHTMGVQDICQQRTRRDYPIIILITDLHLQAFQDY